jgi:hypothetical protein
VDKYYDKKDQMSDKKDQVPRFKLEESKMWAVMEETMDVMGEVEGNSLGDCLKDVEVLKQVKVHFQFLLNELNSVSSSNKEVKDVMTLEQQLVAPGNP